jgi:DNA-directed RNA polymerase subunit M/transcription elongation factor TFIIS
MQYCPNCVIELEKNSKKLGGLTLWLVCPKCGHRERAIYHESTSKAAGYAADRIKMRNKNINQFNIEEYDFTSN